MHGGKTPLAVQARQRRLAESRLRRSLDQVEVHDVDDPVAAFRRLVAEAVALKDELARRVAALGERLTVDTGSTEQVRAEVALYERAIDRAGRLLAEWVRLGMEERLVRVTEAQATLLGQALDKGLAAAGVTPEQRQRAIEVVRRELGAST